MQLKKTKNKLLQPNNNFVTFIYNILQQSFRGKKWPITETVEMYIFIHYL